MATIEPRLIHLLNNSQTPDLPPIQSLSLPPLDPNTNQRIGDRSNPPQIPPISSVNPLADAHLPKLRPQLEDAAFPNDNSGRLTGPARPQHTFGDPESSLAPFSLRMLVDDVSGATADDSNKKRHRAMTTKEDFVQLPQPLKKQKSMQLTQQVVPPIIAGLHEPPPNAAVFPPITSGPFDNGEPPVGGLLMDFGPAPAAAPHPPLAMIEDRTAPNQPAADVDRNATAGRAKRRATKPRNKWTDEETNNLLLGVSRHGVGKWTLIMEDPDFKFNGRTPGDLKDRFRTCCPAEMREDGKKQQSAKYDNKTATSSDSSKPKYGLQLVDLLIDEPSENHQSPPADAETTAKSRKSRAHRKKMEDLANLGICAPFKKSVRRERRAFTEEDDKQILDGLAEYGPSWTKIQRDPKYNLVSRQPTDLRDRVRNKYPEIYARIERGSLSLKEILKDVLIMEPSVNTSMDQSFHNAPTTTPNPVEPSLNHSSSKEDLPSKKHQKRLSAPSHWLLDKLSGVYAPRPSAGPHKLRDCMPLIVFVRNRLKYALNYRETKSILLQRLVKVDGKVRTDMTYPAGFMDVITIEKTGENFRLIYDTKGRFTVHRIGEEESKYKLGKVKRVQLGRGGVPFLVTHDARTIRYPDPAIKVNDTVKIDLETGKISDFIKFDTGAIAMVTGGRNMGRVGVITHRERHDGGFNIVHIKDAIDNTFATRESNVFVIGSEKPWVSLPKGKGVKLTIAEERDRRRATTAAH
ncbi:40S ribosomal protein S4-A [Podospora fimiseda]|uniref:40S ribosomal protein S4-A n=1 Tax=Podospora fimiseda TaxID=252190 RepID=A0AAN7BU33_9PEZI|nr:40S ribosomal protein S4-A [Podospora fimiseda]